MFTSNPFNQNTLNMLLTFPNRTDNSVKNHWNSLIRRRLRDEKVDTSSDHEEEPDSKRIKIDEASNESDIDPLRSTSPFLVPEESITKSSNLLPSLFLFTPPQNTDTGSAKQAIIKSKLSISKPVKPKQRLGSESGFSGSVFVENNSHCLLSQLGVSGMNPQGISASLLLCLGNEMFSMKLSRTERQIQVLRAYTKRKFDEEKEGKKKYEQINGIVLRIESGYVESKPLLYIPMCGSIINLSIVVNPTRNAKINPIEASTTLEGTEIQMSDQIAENKKQEAVPSELATKPPLYNPNSSLVLYDSKNRLFKDRFDVSISGVKYDLRFSLTMGKEEQNNNFFIAVKDPNRDNNVLFLTLAKVIEFPELVAVKRVEYFIASEYLK